MGKGKKLIKKMAEGVDETMTGSHDRYRDDDRRDYRDDYRDGGHGDGRGEALSDRLVRDIQREARRSPLDPTMPDEYQLVVLMRAVGDAADALRYHDTDSEALYRALVRAAAGACSWAQAERHVGRGGRREARGSW